MELCRSCLSKGTHEERRVSQPFKFNGQIVIFENVPALVCGQCGETLLSGETAQRIDELGRGERPPSRMDEVPVYVLSEVA